MATELKRKRGNFFFFAEKSERNVFWTDFCFWHRNLYLFTRDELETNRVKGKKERERGLTERGERERKEGHRNERKRRKRKLECQIKRKKRRKCKEKTIK